jgi:L-asparaginase
VLAGVGEDIMSNATAAKIATRVTDGFTLEEAFAKTFKELKPYDGCRLQLPLTAKDITP